MTLKSEELKAKFKLKNKVAIVGFADSKTEAPYKDDSYDIWGLNSLFEAIPRWDMWFEIHERVAFKMDTNKEIGYGLTRTGQPYMEALAQLKYGDKLTPIMMAEKYPDIPMSERYPLEEMVEKFGNYFNNSVSYMIALAIDWGYQEIAIYGVDMATWSPFEHNAEYTAQRPSCEYFLGIAHGRGIKVFIPDTSDLLKTRFLYGFQDEKKDAFEEKLRKLVKSMQDRQNMAIHEHEEAQKGIDQYIGGLETCQRIINDKWSANDEEIKKMMAMFQGKLNDLMKRHDWAQKQIDQYIGATECTREIIRIWR